MDSTYALEVDPMVVCCIDRRGTRTGNGGVRTRKLEMEDQEQHVDGEVRTSEGH